MFDHIHFDTYMIPIPITPEVVDRVLDGKTFQDHGIPLSSRSNACEPHTRLPDEAPAISGRPVNMQHADFYITGKLESFFRPPVSEFALEHLYYLEAFSIFHCEKHFFTRRRDYDSFLILYTYEGKGRLEYEGKTWHLGKNEGFFIDCKKPHLYSSDGCCWIHSVFHLNGAAVSNLFEHFLKNGSIVFSQPINGPYHTNLERLLTIYGTAFPYRDWQASDCISTLLTELLVSSLNTADKSAAVPENMQYLIHYMEKNYTAPLTLDFLAHFSGISRSHLTREFKKYTGFAPNDYLIGLRIEQARQLLLKTNLPANKIAYMVGIQDINNFTNLFKKKTGLTPGKYRKAFPYS